MSYLVGPVTSQEYRNLESNWLLSRLVLLDYKHCKYWRSDLRIVARLRPASLVGRRIKMVLPLCFQSSEPHHQSLVPFTGSWSKLYSETLMRKTSSASHLVKLQCIRRLRRPDDLSMHDLMQRLTSSSPLGEKIWRSWFETIVVCGHLTMMII